jgi:hypothetical protein
LTRWERIRNGLNGQEAETDWTLTGVPDSVTSHDFEQRGQSLEDRRPFEARLGVIRCTGGTGPEVAVMLMKFL